MPKINEISEESNNTRKYIIDVCKEPTIADELRIKLRCSKNQLNFNLREMLADKQIKIVGTKLNANSRKCFAYLATGIEYKKEVRVKPVIQIHAPLLMEIKDIEYKPLVEQVNSYTRNVYCRDYVKTGGMMQKQSAWSRPHEGVAYT